MNQETFIPGMIGRKIAATLLGLFILALGMIWLWRPIKLAAYGGRATVEVIAVEAVRPGQEPFRLTTRKAVADAEDFTRKTVFKYVIRFDTEDGRQIETYLNYGQVLRPMRSITDQVNVHYNKADPTDLVEAWSPRTGAFGVFFAIIGLIIFVTQLTILLHARTPIVIDSIHAMVNEGNKSVEPEAVGAPPKDQEERGAETKG